MTTWPASAAPGPAPTATRGNPTTDGGGRATVADGSPTSDRAPGWALTGGRKKNMAIAAAAPIDAERGGKGERFTPQTDDEAARLAEYNRYLAALAARDEAEDARRASGHAR